MKPIHSLFFICLIFSTSSFSQVKLAAFAGTQLTTARYTVRGNPQPTSPKVGGMAGVALKIPFENRLYFYPSVSYSLKGYDVELKDPAFPPSELALNNNTTLHTIEIAPLFQIDFSPKPAHSFIRFGPAVDLVMGGRERFDTLDMMGVRGTMDRAMPFSYADYGRFTASANVHLGYETGKGLQVYAFYHHGLGSLNNADAGPNILHRVVGLAVGLYLKRFKE